VSFATVDLYALTGAALIGLGVYGLIAARHLLRRVVAFNVVGSGIFLYFGAAGARGGAPDPVPQALIITGIVVALAASALAVTLVAALARARGTATLPNEGAVLRRVPAERP
jgi:multicomponent Na+:H+ antiporter subunit C